uniref:phosphatidate phosphatase n=1 Tax=Nannospalax galili TaxID=1026970 RepID=A0A8C6QIC1_NANGA
MNYVGQLAETVFGTVKELYRGLNPATLTGGIDVLVVKQADGSFRCSPFHVRFGKLGVLRSREKVLSSDGLMTPKSDSELELRSPESSPLRAESHMQWAWGRLPKVAKAEHPEFSMVSESVAVVSSPLPEGSSTPSSSVTGMDHLESPILEPGASGDLLHPEMEACCEGTLVGPTLAALESRETKTQSSRGAGHPPATKSWSWATLESHIPPEFSRGKGSLKRNQHLGPSDIYLDDLSSLDSENAALYFPQSDCGMGARRWSEPTSQKLLGNPIPEHIPESTLDSMDTIALSLCGGLADSRDISLEKFSQRMVSYEDLTKNPGLVDDPNLVVKINEKHYNWAVAAPMILSLQAFQKNLPESTVDKLEKEKMPRKGGRWWFSGWRRRDFPPEEHSTQREKTSAREQQREKTEVLSSEDDGPDSPVILEVPSLQSSPPAFIPTYKKSLRLSSDQIRCLNLHEGANDVVFSVTTQYQGTCRCKATIYLWKWDDKVVISDIDGTITKSDALGHILPQLGKDWTHQGITSLYHNIHLNGYKFLYCSARAIGMADLTKGYLQWVSERGCGLPKGPILLSPSSLFSALHREVIEKKPEVFKVACLSDIQQLFLPYGHPFYAAFGNRPNDVFAYRQVGLPESRIFTVNPRGELIQELMKNHKSTYERLGEVVELLFPPVVRGPSTDLANPEYSNFCYWREPLPAVDLDALA